MSEKQSFILLISKGILRDRQMRRYVMFWIVAVVLLLLTGGTVLLDRWLMASPDLFLVYWGACLWLTVTSLLLAVYDLLLVRTEARRERQRLKSQAFGGEEEHEKD